MPSLLELTGEDFSYKGGAVEEEESIVPQPEVVEEPPNAFTMTGIDFSYHPPSRQDSSGKITPFRGKREQVHDALSSLDIPKGAVSGIMGNIHIETGGSFDPGQKQRGGKGRGLFQLDPSGPLPKAFAKWRVEEGLGDTAESQVKFVHETIYGSLQQVIGKGNAKKIREVFAKNDPEESAEIFSKLWEKPGTPHIEKRKKLAREIHKELGERNG